MLLSYRGEGPGWVAIPMTVHSVCVHRKHYSWHVYIIIHLIHLCRVPISSLLVNWKSDICNTSYEQSKIASCTYKILAPSQDTCACLHTQSTSKDLFERFSCPLCLACLRRASETPLPVPVLCWNPGLSLLPRPLCIFCLQNDRRFGKDRHTSNVESDIIVYWLCEHVFWIVCPQLKIAQCTCICSQIQSCMNQMILPSSILTYVLYCPCSLSSNTRDPLIQLEGVG